MSRWSDSRIHECRVTLFNSPVIFGPLVHRSSLKPGGGDLLRTCFDSVSGYSVSSHRLCTITPVLHAIWAVSLRLCCQVTLTVARSDTFEFVFPDLEELPLPTVRHVLVRSRLGASVRVPIRLLVLGQIPISVKAMTSAASDFVRTTVLVKVL